jgi:malate permease and related proteins
MNDALQKTATLLLLIALGLLLRSKFKSKAQTDGIKEMVLSVALPATIFIALLKIQVDITLLMVPLATLVFNFFMYFTLPFVLPVFGIEKNSTTGRTLLMLMPSLAPGLSCFPFIAEFLGEKSLAMAAMADVGNKFFVLIFLYIVAMNLFLKNNSGGGARVNARQKIKSLLLSLIKEPINMVLVAAITLLSLGFSFKSLPPVIADLFDKTSAMMTPLVLIFIGLAVQFKEGNKRLVASLLLFRAGLTMLFSAMLIAVTGITDPTLVLLAIVLPLSSASFWPFAHISAFNQREDAKDIPLEKRTFNLELSVLVLAFSLPFSTLLILGILSTGSFFAHLPTLVVTGLTLIGMGLVSNWAVKFYWKLSKT